MFSVEVTINDHNIKNDCSSGIRRESIGIFDFKSIPSCLQQWLLMIIETSKMQSMATF